MALSTTMSYRYCFVIEVKWLGYYRSNYGWVILDVHQKELRIKPSPGQVKQL